MGRRNRRRNKKVGREYVVGMRKETSHRSKGGLQKTGQGVGKQTRGAINEKRGVGWGGGEAST